MSFTIDLLLLEIPLQKKKKKKKKKNFFGSAIHARDHPSTVDITHFSINIPPELPS